MSDTKRAEQLAYWAFPVNGNLMRMQLIGTTREYLEEDIDATIEMLEITKRNILRTKSKRNPDYEI